MSACLNPGEPHAVSAQSRQDLLCAEPGCTFFMEGAIIGPWQVRSLFQHTDTADLYLATSMGEVTAKSAPMLVKALKGCASGSYMRLGRAQSLLQHPHIHQLRYAGWLGQEQMLYVVSRFEAGGSLIQYLSPERSLSLSAICTVVSSIASALQHMHEQRLLHGRIKPENCLLHSPESLQISDFYHTLLFRQIPLVPSLCIAPEQMRGMALPASDQYALGVIACQLLSVHFVQQPAISPQPFSIDDSLITFPQRVQYILRQALHVNPARRFSSVLEFALQLQKAVSQQRYSGPLRPDQVPPLSLPAPASPSAEPPHRERSVEIVQARSYPEKALALCKLPGHSAPITHISWAFDGVHLASASSDRKIRIWSIQRRIGTARATLLSEDGDITALSWSPEGRYLAAATESRAISLWSVTTTPTVQIQPAPTLSWWGHDGAVLALSWSPDGSQLVSGGKDRAVRLWDVKGNLLTSWQARGSISALAWSPDGRRIAAGGSDHGVSIWDTTSGELLSNVVQLRDDVQRLSWSPDGRLLASYAGKKDFTVYLWDTQNPKGVLPLAGHLREVVGLFWSPAIDWLLTASTDRTLRCWDLRQSPPVLHNRPILLDEVPLNMDGVGTKNVLACGTTSMAVTVFQLI